jgi:hypothetical protein
MSKTKTELLAENRKLRSQLRKLQRTKKRRKFFSRGPSEEEIRAEARRLTEERAYNERYASLERQGFCGRCGCRKGSCICE